MWLWMGMISWGVTAGKRAKVLFVKIKKSLKKEGQLFLRNFCLCEILKIYRGIGMIVLLWYFWCIKNCMPCTTLQTLVWQLATLREEKKVQCVPSVADQKRRKQARLTLWREELQHYPPNQVVQRGMRGPGPVKAMRVTDRQTPFNSDLCCPLGLAPAFPLVGCTEPNRKETQATRLFLEICLLCRMQHQLLLLGTSKPPAGDGS